MAVGVGVLASGCIVHLDLNKLPPLCMSWVFVVGDMTVVKYL
jgi:hypothetical protein